MKGKPVLKLCMLKDKYQLVSQLMSVVDTFMKSKKTLRNIVGQNAEV